MESNTDKKFESIIGKCKDIFLKKNSDYGHSWTFMRASSLTDQIYIKALRIRTIQESQINRVGDSELDEFHSIINYCIMAMMVVEKEVKPCENYSVAQLSQFYDTQVDKTRKLLADKNADYGEAWRDMRVSSMTDLILTKLLRIKQIEDNGGKTEVSEGVYSNYQDILNYAVFSIILLSEN